MEERRVITYPLDANDAYRGGIKIDLKARLLGYPLSGRLREVFESEGKIEAVEVGFEPCKIGRYSVEGHGFLKAFSITKGTGQLALVTWVHGVDKGESGLYPAGDYDIFYFSLENQKAPLAFNQRLFRLETRRP